MRFSRTASIVPGALLLLQGVDAGHHYIHEAMTGERVSGFGPRDEPEWTPSFFDESPPHCATRVSRENWEVVCSSSQGDHACKSVLDGQNTTSWWSGSDDAEHSITVNLKNVYNVNAVVILPPIDASSSGGLITQHEVYISTDGEKWSGPVAYGMWPDTNRQRMSVFDPKQAKYVKVVSKAQSPGEKHLIGISELNVYATQYSIPEDPKLGLWGPTLDFPIVPVSGAQEASGNIALWSSWATDQFHSTPGGKTVMTIWSPTKERVSKRTVTNTHHDMFCPGIAIDGTGKMVITGGNDASETSLYDSDSDSWIKGPEMILRRGYQASTTLSDGRVFVIGGSWAGGSNIPKNGEVYDPVTRNWTLLPGAKVGPMLTDDMEGPWRADNHGWIFGWKNRTVFQAGPSRAMNWYFTDNDGDVQSAGIRLDDGDSMSGNAVMFDAVAGKILTVGGSPDYDKDWATSNAHVITLGEVGEEPKVELAGEDGQMHYERVFHTSVVLPNGQVFIAGGQTFGVAFNEENVQFVPEIYDPKTNTFIKLQQNNLIRVYHTLSILLPDGRVLNGGGGLCGNCSANHYDAQIYTPPYLLTDKGDLRPRPKILDESLPDAQVGGEISFSTDGIIGSASLVRLGSATHTVNTDQRRVPLALTKATPQEKGQKAQGSQEYKVQLPSDAGILIPGYWMLFVMNEDGVPGVAKTVMITVDGKRSKVLAPEKKLKPEEARKNFPVEDSDSTEYSEELKRGMKK